MPPEDTTPPEPAAPVAAPAPSAEPAPLPPALTADAAPAAIPLAAGDGAPVADAPAVVEPTAPVADALKPHTEQQPGLLGADPAAKPADPKPDDKPADKPAEPPKPDAPVVEAIKYEPFVPPEGVTLNAEKLSAIDEKLAAARVPPELRTELYNEYIGEVQALAQRTLQAQHDAFAQTKSDWVTAVKSDPELGGSAFQTSIDAADRMIRAFTTDAQRPAFIAMLNTTGADSHPEMVRFLVNLAKKFDEPAPAPTPMRPPPDIGKRTGGNGRARDFYDNPRSQEIAGAR